MNTYGLYSESFFKEPSRFLPGKLLEVVRLRANPRSRGHMKELFLKRYPDGIFAEDLSVLDRARGQDKVILLYPDATGLGFCSIENKVRSKRLNVVALNGRGRFFPPRCPHPARAAISSFPGGQLPARVVVCSHPAGDRLNSIRL